MAGADWLLVATVALAPIALSVASATGNDTLTWFASPLRWPRFDPLVALALLPLLAPLLRRRSVPTTAAAATTGTPRLAPADLGVST